MTTKELIDLLQTYPPDSTVSICHYDRGTTLREVEMVADNCGPSIYAEGWEADHPPMIHPITEGLTLVGVWLSEEQAEKLSAILNAGRNSSAS